MYEALNSMLIMNMEKNAASTEDIYSVLPLDWNNESYYHKFVDSEKMKKYVIAFYD